MSLNKILNKKNNLAIEFSIFLQKQFLQKDRIESGGLLFC